MADTIYSPPYPLTIANATRKFSPVNRCIYCGTFSKHLGKEHILPFGLAGDALILPKASCRACESVTSAIERTLLRTILGPFRIKVGAPTRRPGERPETLKMEVARIDKPGATPVLLETLDLSVDEFPLVFVGMRLRLPTLISGEYVEPNTVNGDIWTRQADDAIAKFNLSDGRGVKLGTMQPHIFMRSIAKIAYSYAVAMLGYGNFEPLVTEYIRGKSDRDCEWVGGDYAIPPAEPILHNLTINIKEVGVRRFVLVGVRLFLFFATPQYWVVVGELKGNQDGIPLDRKALDGIRT